MRPASQMKTCAKAALASFASTPPSSKHDRADAGVGDGGVEPASRIFKLKGGSVDDAFRKKVRAFHQYFDGVVSAAARTRDYG